MDIAFTNNDEKEFIRIAEKLGIKELYLIYPYSKNIQQFKENLQKEQNDTKVKLNFGLIAEQKDIIRARNICNFVITRASGQDQRIIENLRPSLIFDLEAIANHDPFHFRASGLNQVLCKAAAKNNVIVGFSFSTILNSIKLRRAVILGRIMQNIRLCRKYNVKTALLSFAKKPYELRAKNNLNSLKNVLEKK